MQDMTGLHIVGDLTTTPLEGGRPDSEGIIETIGAMPEGTVRGKATIGMVVRDRQTGKRIYCETTLRLFMAAADVFRIRYADELADPNP